MRHRFHLVPLPFPFNCRAYLKALLDLLAFVRTNSSTTTVREAVLVRSHTYLFVRMVRYNMRKKIKKLQHQPAADSQQKHAQQQRSSSTVYLLATSR